jgi:hypothetical protein
MLTQFYHIDCMKDWIGLSYKLPAHKSEKRAKDTKKKTCIYLQDDNNAII